MAAKKVNLDGTKKKRKGRSTRMSQKLLDAIIRRAELGVPHVRIQKGLGIKKDCWDQWYHRGKTAKAGSLLSEFVRRIDEAPLKAETVWIGKINNAALSGDWKAAAHLLACRFPEEWAKASRHDVNAKVEQVNDPTPLVTVMRTYACPNCTCEECTKGREQDSAIQNLLKGLREDGTPYPDPVEDEDDEYA